MNKLAEGSLHDSHEALLAAVKHMRKSTGFIQNPDLKVVLALDKARALLDKADPPHQLLFYHGIRSALRTIPAKHNFFATFWILPQMWRISATRRRAISIKFLKTNLLNCLHKSIRSIQLTQWSPPVHLELGKTWNHQIVFSATVRRFSVNGFGVRSKIKLSSQKPQAT
ncbi:hypothetical protein KEM48_008770 [Puccinia striiformis f. sp. tritici PST-130]|nr:hypothetical protein KEM48_008770 [Puccinia striiformis f. sp. tritici PST-130]